jgi:SNF2 family DNA or RNA helicase
MHSRNTSGSRRHLHPEAIKKDEAEQKRRVLLPTRIRAWKRMRLDSDNEDHSDEEPEEPLQRIKRIPDDMKPAFVRSAWVTRAKLRDYQLEGVTWMVSLWENGISGILGEPSLI